jgi:hypothetical protein
MRRLLIGLAAGVIVVAGASPAAADHTHFRTLGNGECVLLAPDGGEKSVRLPHAESYAEPLRHPLHVNVHLGTPGERGTVYVAYSVTGQLTADAQRLCDGEFVNR